MKYEYLGYHTLKTKRNSFHINERQGFAALFYVSCCSLTGNTTYLQRN
uniref:Uncharacterized protein n=1 Tax=Amphimedon queenslandica TaxID=400682 RepID=A0A1X7UVQ6_AMPQE